MSYSVFQISTDRIAHDDKGFPHTYSTKEQAENVCDELNYDNENPTAEDKYRVMPT